MPLYNAPTLTTIVTLRNPADRPTIERDRYGRITNSQAWGVKVYALRRDGRPETLLEEAVTVYSSTTVWMIRERAGVDADVEVVSDGVVYRSVGPPRLMGGVVGERVSRYLEIHCVRRD